MTHEFIMNHFGLYIISTWHIYWLD